MRGQGSVVEECGADAQCSSRGRALDVSVSPLPEPPACPATTATRSEGSPPSSANACGPARGAAARDDHVEPPCGGPPFFAHSWSAPRCPVNCVPEWVVLQDGNPLGNHTRRGDRRAVARVGDCPHDDVHDRRPLIHAVGPGGDDVAKVVVDPRLIADDPVALEADRPWVAVADRAVQIETPAWVVDTALENAQGGIVNEMLPRPNSGR